MKLNKRLILVVLAILATSGCAQKDIVKEPEASLSIKSTSTKIPSAAPTPVVSVSPTSIDVSKVKPNEMGKIMVVMFHNFVETFTPSKWDKGEYTTTFDNFEKLLPELYEKGYRLISMSDYLNNNINVPAGCIPMIFTFDDATSGQFNLVKEGDALSANKRTAVGIMEGFFKTHPDFGLEGSFYINLGGDTFSGEGTLQERLKYLTDKGFELGNHTLNHVHLNEIQTADKVQEEIGGNQNKMYELIPEYKFNYLSLPFGQPSGKLKEYVVKGEYQGTKYENSIILEVGWDPTYSPVSKNYNPLSLHRVRASGITPVDADLAWWMKNLGRADQYVSDGDPNTITIPKEKEEYVNKDSLKDKKLRTY